MNRSNTRQVARGTVEQSQDHCLELQTTEIKKLAVCMGPDAQSLRLISGVNRVGQAHRVSHKVTCVEMVDS